MLNGEEEPDHHVITEPFCLMQRSTGAVPELDCRLPLKLKPALNINCDPTQLEGILAEAQATDPLFSATQLDSARSTRSSELMVNQADIFGKASSSTQSWTVPLDRRGDEDKPIGICFAKPTAGKFKDQLIVHVVREIGHAHDYNENQPDENFHLRRGDRVVGVNKVHGDSDAMSMECQASKVLTLFVERDLPLQRE